MTTQVVDRVGHQTPWPKVGRVNGGHPTIAHFAASIPQTGTHQNPQVGPYLGTQGIASKNLLPHTDSVGSRLSLDDQLEPLPRGPLVHGKALHHLPRRERRSIRTGQAEV